jgi:hypothetical protein
VIAMPFRPYIGLPLLETRDEPWIGQVLDVVEASIGQSWRALFARLERTPLCANPAEAAAVANALRRAAGARTNDGPVSLPNGRPAGRTLAALVNLDRIQRAARRSHQVQLQLWEGADERARAAAHLGLPAQVARGPGGATVLDFAGPPARYHDAAAYERALAVLVSRLADHARFRLELHTRVGASARERTICVEPPVLLPPALRLYPRPPAHAARLAAELAAAGRVVTRDPAPIPSGDHLLFPDLELALGPATPDGGGDGGGRADPRAWIELVGFATDEHLARKLARYEAAASAASAASAAPTGAAPRPPPLRRYVLCIDAARCPHARAGQHGPLGAILPFRRRIDPAALLALLAPLAPP